MIFLEEYISHKNVDTFHTLNRNEIMLRCYNVLMGNTEQPIDQQIIEEPIDNQEGIEANHDQSRDSESSDYLQNYPDARFPNVDTTVDEVISLSDTEELEILEGFGLTVFEKLTADTKKDSKDLHVLPQPLIFEENSEEKCMPSVQSETEYCSSESKQFTSQKIAPTQVLPHPLTFKDNAEEKLLSAVRSKNEYCSSKNKQRISQQIVNIFYYAIIDMKEPSLREMKVEFILKSVQEFLEMVAEEKAEFI